MTPEEAFEVISPNIKAAVSEVRQLKATESDKLLLSLLMILLMTVGGTFDSELKRATSALSPDDRRKALNRLGKFKAKFEQFKAYSEAPSVAETFKKLKETK